MELPATVHKIAEGADSMDAARPVSLPASDNGTAALVCRPDTGRTVTVMATYRLSEQGRKLSLVAGGDGRALQEMKVSVPTNRLHLISVDTDGTARLKLRPQYYLDSKQNITRRDASPLYDTPPTVEDLLKDAARNHQLERAYDVQRSTTREARNETRQKLAEQFLNTPEMRALKEPKPTPRWCYVLFNERTVFFDSKQHHDLARQVPPEAYRRFTADLRARSVRGRAVRSQCDALHAMRTRFIAEWIDSRGTSDQKARYGAGDLDEGEVVEALGDEAFSAITDQKPYRRNGVRYLQTYLRRLPKYAHLVVTPKDLIAAATLATTATDTQLAFMRTLEAAVPEARAVLLVHRLRLRTDGDASALSYMTVLLTCRVGPFIVRREYLVPDTLDEGILAGAR